MMIWWQMRHGMRRQMQHDWQQQRDLRQQMRHDWQHVFYHELRFFLLLWNLILNGGENYF
jgi:hypothetical protein